MKPYSRKRWGRLCKRRQKGKARMWLMQLNAKNRRPKSAAKFPWSCFKKAPLLKAYWQDQHGGIAPFVALGLAGVMFAGAYVVDATRMTTSAAQLKRATDAAAMAVAMDSMEQSGQSAQQLNQLAEQYVRSNLGMDSRLNSQIEDIQVATGRSGIGWTYRVSLQLNPVSPLLGAVSEPIHVHSTAYAEMPKTEIALVLPGPEGNNFRSNSRALAEIINEFVDEMFVGAVADTKPNLRIGVVPYGVGVNVSLGQKRRATPLRVERLRKWVSTRYLKSPPANVFTPNPEVIYFDWRDTTPRVDGFDHPLIPDNRVNKLCITDEREVPNRFYWRDSAIEAFRLNNPVIFHSPENPYIRMNRIGEPHYLLNTKNCPEAIVLPLEESREKIKKAVMDNTDYQIGNVNYGSGLVWAGRVLSPDMRGDAGWGDDVYPLDFEESKKYIIMLAVDAGYGSDDVQKAAGSPYTESNAISRFSALCQEYTENNIETNLIVFYEGSSDQREEEAREDTPFYQTIGNPMKLCTNGDERISYVNGSSFSSDKVREILRQKLKNIADDILKTSNQVRLID